MILCSSSAGLLRRHFLIGDVAVSLSGSDVRLLDDYATLYHEHRCPRPGVGAVRVHIDRQRPSGWHRRRFVISVNSRRQFQPTRREEVVPYLDWAVNWEVPQAKPHCLHLHAASMEVDGMGIILPAVSGSGKSTLAAGLLQAGWRYFCDEFAMIDAEQLTLVPYPRAICIKRPSFAAVGRMGLPLFGRRFFLKGSKGYVGYIRPGDVRPGAVAEPCPVRYVVFPKYVPGATPGLTPISRAEAAFSLHEVCFNLMSCRAVGLDVIAAVVRGAECFRLTAGELEPTCALLDQLVRTSR